MLPIHKQVERDFKWLLKQKETPTITIAYDTIAGATSAKFYGNNTGGTITPHTITVKAIVEPVNEWTVKRLPYVTLKVGQTIFYVDKSIDLSDAKNIRVICADRVFAIQSVQQVIPLNATYLCQVLISSE